MKQLNNFIIEKLKITKNTKIIVRDKEHWSILNAEDGDIVKWNGDVLFFIYKCLNTGYDYSNASEDAIVYHATYIADHRKKLDVCTDTGVGTIKNPHLYQLATDEECENFYKALEKNGYKWDDIKKEVVKL